MGSEAWREAQRKKKRNSEAWTGAWQVGVKKNE